MATWPGPGLFAAHMRYAHVHVCVSLFMYLAGGAPWHSIPAQRGRLATAIGTSRMRNAKFLDRGVCAGACSCAALLISAGGPSLCRGLSVLSASCVRKPAGVSKG